MVEKKKKKRDEKRSLAINRRNRKEVQFCARNGTKLEEKARGTNKSELQ